VYIYVNYYNDFHSCQSSKAMQKNRYRYYIRRNWRKTKIIKNKSTKDGHIWTFLCFFLLLQLLFGAFSRKPLLKALQSKIISSVVRNFLLIGKLRWFQAVWTLNTLYFLFLRSWTIFKRLHSPLNNELHGPTHGFAVSTIERLKTCHKNFSDLWIYSYSFPLYVE